jgi:multidrug efflux pump
VGVYRKLKLTMNIFIEKPVYAIVFSLLILLIGLVSADQLAIQEFPSLKISTITIATLLPGAAPDKVQSFVTEPLEQAIASIDGVDYITAASSSGESDITINVQLNADPNAILTNVISKINAIQYQLPNGVEDPAIRMQTGVSFPAFISSFTSDNMTPEQISAYLAKVIRPALQSISGLAFINIFGNKPYALRVWLDPVKMLAHQVTAADISAALSNNNVLAAPGEFKNALANTGIDVSTDLHTAAQFANTVVRSGSGTQVRLNDIARIEIGAQNYDSSLIFNGKKSVNLAFILQPGANPITVIKQVRARLALLTQSFPPDLQYHIVYDSTRYIKESLHEVTKTLIETIIIVTLIVFFFLGSLRITLIPVVAIPLSLVGASIFLYAFNFSINTLVLLAMVLAIGLVVDDAIVVLENTHRLAATLSSMKEASLASIKQIFIPIITMSLTLAVVFAPLGFIGGLTGALFKEFAFTLSVTVIVSGVVAVILTPMLCSRLLQGAAYNSAFYLQVNSLLATLQQHYLIILNICLKRKHWVLIFSLLTLFLCFTFFHFTPHLLAPQEDQNYLGVAAHGPAEANLNYLTINNNYLEKIYANFPGRDKFFIVNGLPQANALDSGLILTPSTERHYSQAELADKLQQQLFALPGLQAFVYQIPSLPMAGGGPPVQFVLTSTLSHEKIYQIANELVQRARQSGLFAFINPDIHFDDPQIYIDVDRQKAADLGISMAAINQALAVLWSGNYINYFSLQGTAYQVIPQAEFSFSQNANALQWVYIRGGNNILVPLSSMVTIHRQIIPAVLPQFQQMNAITLQGVPAKGVSLGEALQYLQKAADQMLPSQMSYNYSGESRAFVLEANKIGYLLIFALLLIYLLLVLQFESFFIPLIVIMSVPLALSGALFVLFCGAATINIYTEIGLLTLVGLISKHGILLIDFAVKRSQKKISFEQMIIEAARQRLRPILMTTAAMIFGVLPLLLSQGAGSNSRFDLGIVIFFGMLIGTLFTLLVLPALFVLLMTWRDRFF